MLKGVREESDNFSQGDRAWKASWRSIFLSTEECMRFHQIEVIWVWRGQESTPIKGKKIPNMIKRCREREKTWIMFRELTGGQMIELVVA